MSDRHLVIFEPNSGGHHGLFVQHLINYWGKYKLKGVLELVVTENFVTTHGEISSLLSTYTHSDIRLSHIDPLPPLPGNSIRNLIQHDFRQGAILKKKLVQLRPSHTLLMYFDHLQLSLGTTLKFAPETHIAGIYFRPSFHYPILVNPASAGPGMLTRVRKKAQLKLALSNPRLRTLFSLDPYIVPTLNEMSTHTQAVILPDGVERIEEEREPNWNIEDHRFTAFCFGSLARRKGVFNLLDALPKLSKNAQDRLALVFTGVVAAPERKDFYEKVDQIRTRTSVQIVIDDRFVEDIEVPSMIRRADLIMVAYQQHVGSSNVLIRAAEAGIPVLGSTYGLIGAQIHDHRLGTAVNTTSADALAEGISWHMDQPINKRFNPEQAKHFAANHSATLYAETIFSSLGFA